MNSEFEYCVNKAAPAGSNFHYATIFEQADFKSTLIPLYALHTEFIDCLSSSPDPGVTRLKFSWWHEELDRLSTNNPRHPVTQSIKSITESHPDILPILIDHLACIESIIAINNTSNYRDWLQYYIKQLGTFWLTLNKLNKEHNDASLIIDNGGVIFSLEVMKNYRLISEKTSNFLPADLIEKYSIKNSATPNPKLFEELLTYYKYSLEDSHKGLKASEHKPALFNLIFNKLAQATINEIIIDGSKIMEHKIHLTPIRKLYISVYSRLSYI